MSIFFSSPILYVTHNFDHIGLLKFNFNDRCQCALSLVGMRGTESFSNVESMFGKIYLGTHLVCVNFYFFCMSGHMYCKCSHWCVGSITRFDDQLNRHTGSSVDHVQGMAWELNE